MHALRSKSKSVPSNILNHAPQQAASAVEPSTAKVQEVLEGLGINIKVLVESFTKVLVEPFTKGEPLNLMSPLLTRICERLNLLPLTGDNLRCTQHDYHCQHFTSSHNEDDDSAVRECQLVDCQDTD